MSASGLSRDKKKEAMKEWLSPGGRLEQLASFPVRSCECGSIHRDSFRRCRSLSTQRLTRTESILMFTSFSPPWNLFVSLSRLMRRVCVHVYLVLWVSLMVLGRDKYRVILKRGDDLRQDQLIVQLISLMDRLLKKENLNLNLVSYKVLINDALLPMSH